MLRRSGALCAALLLAAPLAPRSAAARATALSDLWREWVVLHRQLRDARTEVEQARRAVAALQAARERRRTRLMEAP